MPPLQPCQITCLVDTREQWPFDMGKMKMEEASLQTGDYGVKGLEKDVRVERKSMSDLVSCMSQKAQRDRFKRELERLTAFPERLVVVEGSFNELREGEYHSLLHPNAAMSTVASWWGEFNVGFMFASSRDSAQEFTRRFLFNAARRFLEQRERMGIS